MRFVYAIDNTVEELIIDVPEHNTTSYHFLGGNGIPLLGVAILKLDNIEGLVKCSVSGINTDGSFGEANPHVIDLAEGIFDWLEPRSCEVVPDKTKLEILTIDTALIGETLPNYIPLDLGSYIESCAVVLTTTDSVV